MATAFLIQVKRGGDWRKVTTVSIEQKRYDPDQSRARAVAYVEATRQLAGWQTYDGFAGLPLRIAEEIGFGKFAEARP